MKSTVVLLLLIAVAVAFALRGAGASEASDGAPPAAKAARADYPAPDANGKVVLDEAQWKERLSSQEFHVLREQGTERAFTGDLWDSKHEGTYTCAGCGQELFSSSTKFDSGTGWPSYWAPIAEDHVATTVDRAWGMTRTEVHCSRCGGHLGHIFTDGPRPTGLRYCINSVSLDFVPKEAPPAPAPPKAAE
jgi:peptide-methionine (R)-S-oxide reductase